MAYFVYYWASVLCHIQVFSYLYTHSSLHCGQVQLCYMSVSKPLVIPIFNGTTFIKMVNLFQRICVRFEKYYECENTFG